MQQSSPTHTSDHSKALFMVPRYWPGTGGAELHSRELARQLSLRGPIGVVRHCSDETAAAELAYAQAPTLQLDDNGIPLYQLGACGPLQGPLTLAARYYQQHRLARPVFSALYKTMTRDRLLAIARDYDLLHAVYNGFTPSAELAAEVCQRLDKPFVWTPLAHTSLPPGSGWSSRGFRCLYQRADALIAMTAYEREWLIGQGAHPDRVHVCPVSTLLADTADATQFRADFQLGEHPFVLYLGRMTEAKGYRLLSQATAAVWEQNPTTRFVFLGPPSAASERWFAEHQDPRILTPGLLSERDKTSALAACNMLCVPSVEESLGVMYLEAWSFAKPVIAVDLPVLRTVINAGGDGLLVKPQAEAIASALNQLLANPAAGAEMGRRGAQKVAENYNWPVIAERMASIHRHVLSGNAAALSDATPSHWQAA